MRCRLLRFVVFDVETTGLYVDKGHRIIEIGAVAVSGTEMGEEFQSLISTKAPISKAVQKIHGITPEVLVGQPDAKEVLTRFRDFVGDSTLVAHNAAFDMGFLLSECDRAGIRLISRYECTLKRGRRRFRFLPDYKLETVARYLEIPVDETRRHRALDDALLTARVWIEMRRR
jgi:DNA polymerase III subunit epsilon